MTHFRDRSGPTRIAYQEAIRSHIRAHPDDGPQRVSAATGCPLWLAKVERATMKAAGIALAAPRRPPEVIPLEEPDVDDDDDVNVIRDDDRDERDERIRELEAHVADLSMECLRLRRVARGVA